MFKKVILSLISVIMIITVIPGSSVYASGFSKKDSDILKKDDVIGISHSDKVGWYLEKEIPESSKTHTQNFHVPAAFYIAFTLYYVS